MLLLYYGYHYYHICLFIIYDKITMSGPTQGVWNFYHKNDGQIFYGFGSGIACGNRAHCDPGLLRVGPPNNNTIFGGTWFFPSLTAKSC